MQFTRVVAALALMALLTVEYSAVATAQGLDQQADAGNGLGKLATLLGTVAIVVVFLESALSSVFNWRVYREVINQRAMKTPIMLAVGLAICLSFDYDPFSLMLISAGAEAQGANGSWLTLLLSAMILAGGSSGINTLFRSLGLREALPEIPPKPALADNEAWVSIRVNGTALGGKYQIALTETASTADALIVGTVARRRFWERVKEAFRSEANRFPGYGGWSLKSKTVYRIDVINNAVQPQLTRLVFEGAFAPRAIVDFDVSF